MKGQKPLDLRTVVHTFAAIPELAGVGAFAGANALYLEHIENPLGRFSLDIDLQNQTDEIEAIHRRFSPQTRKKLKLISRLSAEMYEYQNFSRIAASVRSRRMHGNCPSAVRPPRLCSATSSND